jgi:hypothetical protein
MCGLTGFLSANNNHDFINHTVRRMTSALTHRGPDAGAVWMDEEVGDSAYIIGDTGTIVPVGDMRALADGVLELLALPAGERESLRQRARSRVKELFEIGHVARTYEQTFEEVRRTCAA